MWLLSYLGANWSLILCVVLIVAALIAVGIFARNWKAFVAAGAILAAGYAYQQIDKNGFERAKAEELASLNTRHEQEIADLHQRIIVLNWLGDQHEQRTMADSARINELEEMSRATPVNDNRCLDRAATRRVRDIRWENRAGAPAASGKSKPAAAPSRHFLQGWPFRRAGQGS
jgi:hypothetical protein